MSTSYETLAARVRPLFPALQRTVGERSVAYFDGPGGTQVPQAVVGAMTEYLLQHNANDGWAYATSRETDATVSRARASVTTFLGAASANEIVFGANMTTLTFHIARAVGRGLSPGDEVVVSDLDHHANIDPWVALARDYGVVIRRIPLLHGRPELDLAAYEQLLGARTKVVAIGLSSNAFGTVNPVAEIAAAAHRAGALVFVDAVHAAAHAPLDVAALGADLLAFSAYKVYGPHVGVLYCRDDILERLDVPRLAPQRRAGPKRAESGTLNFEGIAGTGAALDFLASLCPAAGGSPRERSTAALQLLAREEDVVFAELVAGLRELPHVTTYEPSIRTSRHPTIAFSVRGFAAEAVSALLSETYGIFVSHGDFYASTAVAQIAPAAIESGGVVRAGIGIYSTPEDVRRLVDAVASLASAKRLDDPSDGPATGSRWPRGYNP